MLSSHTGDAVELSARPAAAYSSCDDLWIVTTFFNPAGYRALRRNYDRFAEPIVRAGINLLTVECAFDRRTFELDPSPQVVQVRSRSVMWLKERLLNLAISCLPPGVGKVMWTDCDLLFGNPDWAVETAALLDKYALVQPCASLHRLGRNQLVYHGKGYFRHSFAYQFQRRPESARLWSGAHGFPGAAWAAPRALVAKHGLYDAAVLGGGDELFAHAAGGGLNSRCVRAITDARVRSLPRTLDRIANRALSIPWPQWLAARYLAHPMAVPTPEPGEPSFAHYLTWARPFCADVRDQIGYVPGLAFHLWHGDPANRQYSGRDAIRRRHGYDPASDLRLNEQHVWEWASAKPGLHQEVEDYFFSRREDG